MDIITELKLLRDSVTEEFNSCRSNLFRSYYKGKIIAYSKAIELASTGRWTAEVPTENGWYIIAIPRRTVFIAEMYDGTFTYNGMRWTPLAGTLYAIVEIPPLP